MPAFKVSMICLAVVGVALAGYSVATTGDRPTATLVIGVTLAAVGFLAYVNAHFGDPRAAYELGRRDEAKARERTRHVRAA